jgi:hypothetical protein
MESQHTEITQLFFGQTLRLLDTRPAGLDDAFDEYRLRCTLLLERAFRRTTVNEKRAFSDWLVERYEKSRDKPGFLHEEPLRRIARYLLNDPLAIPAEIREEVAKLIQEKNW